MTPGAAKAAGLPATPRPHSFPVLVVTDLLAQHVPLADVRYLAGHTDPQTAQLDHRCRMTPSIVERISV